MGDARNSDLVNAVAFGAYDLTDRCVRLTGQSLSPELKRVKPPYLEDLHTHLPTSHVVSGWFDEIPMWNFLWVWQAWEAYTATGDRAALEPALARGTVPTPRGPVSVAWQVGEDGRLQIEYHAPEGCEVEVVAP